jgi:diaminopropionate ammonia-lyase
VARAAGVAALHYKDEAHRFALGSFKALGGAYAVLRLLQDALAAEGIEATAADLIAGRHRDRVAAITVCCATDGNHGRSVAWGARMFGCRCRIYIHENVSLDREAAIAAYGATMVRLPATTTPPSVPSRGTPRRAAGSSSPTPTPGAARPASRTSSCRATR